MHIRQFLHMSDDVPYFHPTENDEQFFDTTVPSTPQTEQK